MITSRQEAVAFVCDVLTHRLALISKDFKDAMELCERFDIRAQEVLVFQKARARNA